MKRMGWIKGLAAVGVAAIAGGVATTASAYSVNGGGLVSEPANFACTTTSPCLANKTFDLLSQGIATGTIDVSGSTATVSLSVASFSFNGSFGGVDEIDFTNVTYNAVLNVTVVGDTITGGGQLGTVAGTYEQKNLGGTVVGPTAFSESAMFLALNCSVPGGAGTCALQVGSGTAGQYDLDINGAGLNRFINTFNVTVVPEPGTFALLAGGLALLAIQRRRSR